MFRSGGPRCAWREQSGNGTPRLDCGGGRTHGHGQRIEPREEGCTCVCQRGEGGQDNRRVPRTARPQRAQPDCHSEGHDSDFSGEEDEDAGPGKSEAPKKTAVRSRTYGLCHLSRDEGEDRGPRGAAAAVNKRSDDASTRFKEHTPACPSQRGSASQGFLTRGALSKAVPAADKQSTSGSCHSSSLTMPVILYDGSEEELMDTIEREFS